MGMEWAITLTNFLTTLHNTKEIQMGMGLQTQLMISRMMPMKLPIQMEMAQLIVMTIVPTMLQRQIQEYVVVEWLTKTRMETEL